VPKPSFWGAFVNCFWGVIDKVALFVSKAEKQYEQKIRQSANADKCGFIEENRPHSPFFCFQSGTTGVGNCPILGILDITF
jgi:hypothetical protein